MVPPGDNVQNNTATSYTMTMDDFLKKLDCIRKKLWMKRGVYITDQQPVFVDEDEDDYQERNFQGVLRFASLDEVADEWVETPPPELSETVFRKLNAFLNRDHFATSTNQKTRWEKTLTKHNDDPCFKKAVGKCINDVRTDKDKAELAKRYGIEEFPDVDYDFEGKNGERTTEKDMSVLSVLGLILLWFTALPYTEEAESERTRYCDQLEDQLELLVQPEQVLDPNALEFRSFYKKTYHGWIINEILKASAPTCLKANEEVRDDTHNHVMENEKGRTLS